MVRISPPEYRPGRNACYQTPALPAHQPPQAGASKKPATHKPSPFTILIDQQEKAPFPFTGITVSGRPLIIPTRRVHLPTGDYSLAGVVEVKGADKPTNHDFRNSVVIERKSLSDLFGSLAGKDGERRARFKAEHERMQRIIAFGGFAHVVIEASRDEARNSPPEYGAHPNAVLTTSVRWPRRYGVHWHWAGSRNEAEKLTFELLRDAWEQLTKTTTEGMEGPNDD
jgi:ERCC4-type nuclease